MKTWGLLLVWASHLMVLVNWLQPVELVALKKKPAGCGLARCVPQSDHYTQSHTHRLIHKTSLEPPIVAKFMFTSGGGVNQIIMVGGKRHEKDKDNKCNVSPWGKKPDQAHGPMPANGLKVSRPPTAPVCKNHFLYPPSFARERTSENMRIRVQRF
jgi:hypothetical protein